MKLKIEPVNRSRNSRVTNKTKLTKLKENLQNLLSESTSHGLPKVIKAKKISNKILWLMSLLISTSVCVFLIIDSVFKYTTYEVVTKFEVIRESKMLFPTITFYNLNFYQQNFSLDDILIACTFNTRTCTANDFEVTYYQYGVVYQFNSKGLLKSNIAGQLNSLHIELFVGNPQYVRGDLYSTVDGFHVNVHNSSYSPDFSIPYSFSGIDVPLGFFTTIKMERIFTHKLEYPYSECIENIPESNAFDRTIYEFMKNTTNYSYRQKDCIKYCLGKIVIDKCNIKTELDKFDKIVNVINEKNNNSLDCINTTYTNLLETDVIKYCSNYCPFECDSNEFQLTTSTAGYPNTFVGVSYFYGKIPKVIAKFPKNYTITSDDLKRRMLGFRIFYSEFQYTQISQVAKIEMVDFVANIGGLLGLFIGISFLSFIEILEFILNAILILSKN